MYLFIVVYAGLTRNVLFYDFTMCDTQVVQLAKLH
jgi:hypothetical protein